MSLCGRITDVLRAEASGLDLEETADGVYVLAMRRDGSRYKLGRVTAMACLQDPQGALRAIDRIKFAEKDHP